ncbi:GNAT family N-acetyltransferase [Streptomyces blattellae]|uniref:GNAT family N-acetyltransferase n=1 Tax=Streptomyces blattellae TaxID=2569855 RepID=UPI0018AD0C79|nr:GNAT family N-acetyltransferase [Streptomyces blattellae]
MIRERLTGNRVIRTVLPTEADTVAALHARARATYYPDGVPDDGTDWAAAWRGVIVRPDAHVLCAVEDGRIAGVASFRTAEGDPVESVRLFQFHVDPERWGTGVGTALHTACVEQWRVDGKSTAVLDVHADNQRARVFYGRRGWVAEPFDGSSHLRLRLMICGE